MLIFFKLRFTFSGKIVTCDDNDSDNIFIHLIKKKTYQMLQSRISWNI